MTRFLRNPLHRATLVVLVCAGVLGYALPELIVGHTAASAVLTALAVLALSATVWRAVRAARRRRGD
jgi:protein-S-isoprenylcysteine O-methyltransferase Ste14